MAENFISAKDLPISESDSVDVLCVDNGELKLKSGANMGGGGYIIRVPASDVQGREGESIGVILTESFNNFLPILLKGGTVWVDMSEAFGELMLTSVNAWGLMEGAVMLMCSMPGTMIQIGCPNGDLTQVVV